MSKLFRIFAPAFALVGACTPSEGGEDGGLLDGGRNRPPCAVDRYNTRDTALPLALGSGDGAELRVPLGISIVGGLLFSQVLTLYTTPVVYLYLDRFRLWCLRRFRGRSAPIAVPAQAGTPS